MGRIGPRPEPAAIVGSRPRGSRRPHTDGKVAAVRRLIEQSLLTYTEIAARTGVAQASICRWTRDGGWQRPLFAPRATDTVPSARASARLTVSPNKNMPGKVDITGRAALSAPSVWSTVECCLSHTR